MSPFVGTAKSFDDLSDLPSLYRPHTTHTEVFAPVFGVRRV